MAVLFKRDGALAAILGDRVAARGRAVPAAPGAVPAAPGPAGTGGPAGAAGAAGLAEVAGTGPGIEHIVTNRFVTADFQPIMRLDTIEPVGYEAFARGPAGSPLSSPRAMFEAAARKGLA